MINVMNIAWAIAKGQAEHFAVGTPSEYFRESLREAYRIVQEVADEYTGGGMNVQAFLKQADPLQLRKITRKIAGNFSKEAARKMPDEAKVKKEDIPVRGPALWQLYGAYKSEWGTPPAGSDMWWNMNNAANFAGSSAPWDAVDWNFVKDMTNGADLTTMDGVDGFVSQYNAWHDEKILYDEAEEIFMNVALLEEYEETVGNESEWEWYD